MDDFAAFVHLITAVRSALCISVCCSREVLLAVVSSCCMRDCVWRSVPARWESPWRRGGARWSRSAPESLRHGRAQPIPTPLWNVQADGREPSSACFGLNAAEEAGVAQHVAAPVEMSFDMHTQPLRLVASAELAKQSTQLG